MATVYLGRRGGVGGFQRLVAIKRLHPHLARDTEFVDMFIDEAKVAARIHHPHVVPIVDIETSGEGYFLVMEYIEGDTAARLLAKSASAGKRIPAGVTVRILLDSLAGLHAAHELRDDEGKLLEIVHRDVSPQNVLVGVDGIARITDFGVARAASRLSTTRTGQLKGKLAYMAPEQAKGSKSGGVDRRADLFAMGILLWEMTAAKRLFKGDGDAETLNRVLYEPIPTLRSVLPTAPASIDAICSKALDRDPAKRYATAAQFAEDLERAAQAGGFLGTHREVAAHLESILGADISQQRDAVRQWVGRSEPSRGGRTPTGKDAKPASRPSETTRVEGSKPSGGPPPPDDGLNVSSVSSAAIAVPQPAPSHPMPSSPPDADESPARSAMRKRTRRVTFLLAAAAISVIAFLPAAQNILRQRQSAGTRAPTAPSVALVTAASAMPGPTVVAPSTSPAPGVPRVERADGGADQPPFVVASAAAPPSSPAPPTRRRHRSSHSAAAAASAQAQPAVEDEKPAPPEPSLPDDMTHNPYR